MGNDDDPQGVDPEVQAAADAFDREYGPLVKHVLDEEYTGFQDQHPQQTPDCPHLTRFVEPENVWTEEEERHITACSLCQKRVTMAKRIQDEPDWPEEVQADEAEEHSRTDTGSVGVSGPHSSARGDQVILSQALGDSGQSLPADTEPLPRKQWRISAPPNELDCEVRPGFELPPALANRPAELTISWSADGRTLTVELRGCLRRDRTAEVTVTWTPVGHSPVISDPAFGVGRATLPVPAQHAPTDGDQMRVSYRKRSAAAPDAAVEWEVAVLSRLH